MKKKRAPLKRQADEVDKYVGQRIRAARVGAGMSQEKLGDALGLTFQQVQKYERGANRVSCGALVLIAAAVKATPAWFFEGAPGTLDDGATPTKMTMFFATDGAAKLAADFLRLDAKSQTAVRQLAGAL